jgi:hypothetical protein
MAVTCGYGFKKINIPTRMGMNILNNSNICLFFICDKSDTPFMAFSLPYSLLNFTILIMLSM